MGKIIKSAGKNTPQQRKANGQSWGKQKARLAGRTRSLAPKPPDTKRKGW